MEWLNEHISILINVVLALIMFGLGLGLRKHDFQQLFDQPKPLTVGLATQIIILPLFAFALVNQFDISSEIKVGVLILSVCPGGITSNLVSYFSKGNVALSVSLTVTNAIITLITIPVLVNVFLNYFINNGGTGTLIMPFWDTVGSIFLVTILPAAVGMFLRYKFGAHILRLQKSVNLVFPFLLLLIFVIKFLGKDASGNTNISSHEIMSLTPVVVALNLGAIGIGHMVARLFGCSFKNGITISIEVGLHNTALALLVAGELLGVPEMEKPALVYALYSFGITYGISFALLRLRFYRLKKRNQLG